MNGQPSKRHYRYSVACFVGLIGFALRAPAGESTEPLRAELSVERALLAPGDPVRVRFSLFNTTNEPIEIAGVSGEDPLALPHALIFGTNEEPALQLTFEAEKPLPLRPETVAPLSDAKLRLAPRTSVGTEIELAALSRDFHYAGKFRLEWKPLAGKAAPAWVEFRVEGRKNVVFSTDHGKITFTMLYEKAPRNIENFLDLARSKFYDNTPFNKIVPGFILQGGAPGGDRKAMRPDGRLIAAEFSDAPVDIGTLMMARKESDPNSASCQWFIALARLESMDGQYTVIGQAKDEESLRTLRALADLPTRRDDSPLRSVVLRSVILTEAELPVERIEATSAPAAP